MPSDDERPGDQAAPMQPPPLAEPPTGSAPDGIDPAGTQGSGIAAHGARTRVAVPAVIVAGGVALVALVVKFGLPLLLGATVGGLLGGVFGGPFEMLPEDQRQALEQRFEAAVGSSLEGRSARDAADIVDAMLASGLPRLSDDMLVERLLLTRSLLDGTDEATCARLARGAIGGTGDPGAMVTALEGMDVESLGRWFDITVSAIEANAAAAPPARSADPAEVERVVGNLYAVLGEQEAQQVSQVFGGATATDAETCAATRAIYGAMAGLPPADRAVAALVDVSP